ncbi:hypothetical protein PAMC26577_30655 [Caballeronia sordidicola]|uniref:Uncharacterized protein n=1 Tax=Caballeronia sordidicola TaxID=196367 RepID=A0A242MDW3_CABSO|nr:hypothetical protein PAMC26577_30655 [Caballeronia sordidicola]
MRASLPTAAPRLTSWETSAALRMTGRAASEAEDAIAGSAAKEVDMGWATLNEAGK